MSFTLPSSKNLQLDTLTITLDAFASTDQSISFTVTEQGKDKSCRVTLPVTEVGSKKVLDKEATGRYAGLHNHLDWYPPNVIRLFHLIDEYLESEILTT